MLLAVGWYALEENSILVLVTVTFQMSVAVYSRREVHWTNCPTDELLHNVWFLTAVNDSHVAKKFHQFGLAWLHIGNLWFHRLLATGMYR